MIRNGEERYHFAEKKEKLPALVRGITSKHHGNFYWLNCLYSFKTKNKLESHKKLCENKDFCNIVMSSEDNKILEFNQYHKPDKAPFIIYAILIEQIDECKNNPENLSTAKVGEPIPPCFWMSAISTFKSIENKHDLYRDKDYMKKFYKSLKEHAIFVETNLKINMPKIKNIAKFGIIIIIQGNIKVLQIPYVIQCIVYLKKSL